MKGQVHLVTGAASGIGACLVEGLLARGATVLAMDRNEAGLQALKTRLASAALATRVLDVRDAADWQRSLAEAQARYGRIDTLMNVAGVLKPGYVQDFDPADVDFHLDINTKGVIHGTRAAAKLMVAQGSGHIINIASLAGLAPVPGLSLYSASKFAVRGFTLAAAYELKPLGVKVTAVCPDAVATPMLDLQRHREEAALTFSGSRKTLTAADVAQAIFDTVLPKAPFELSLPAHRGRLAKLGSVFPQLNYALLNGLRARGRRLQESGPIRP